MADKINFGDARYTVSHDETKAAMTDSMIERVADAIARSARAVGGGYVSGDEFPWEDAARAAIEAMRTPTAAMQEAAIEAVDSERKAARSGGWSYNECDITWNAMIDAALNEKAGT